MLLPINCPICNDSLLNEFNFSYSSSNLSYKICNKRIDHKFSIKYYSDTNMVTDMNYTFSNNKTVIIWDFVAKKIYVSPNIVIKGRSVGHTTLSPIFFMKKFGSQIPWFEPDITNFPKLLKKIRTYICFS